MKKAIITGASSGIGAKIAKNLSEKGYYVILVARNEDKLSKLGSQLKNGGEMVVCDLSDMKNCEYLYETYKNDEIDILVNDAGFGVFGEFSKTDLKKEIKMIETNVIALHTLTKLFLPNMIKRNKGNILNVSSLAGFMSGPLMSAYYATKAYVIRLSRGISKEIKDTNVKITVLCPGPVDTNFNDVAGVRFSVKPLSAEKVAEYGVNRMFKGKFYAIPGFSAKIAVFFSKFIPDALICEISHRIQKRKSKGISPKK